MVHFGLKTYILTLCIFGFPLGPNWLFGIPFSAASLRFFALVALTAFLVPFTALVAPAGT